MTAYLIVYGKDHTDRLAAYSFPTRASAREASATSLVPRVPSTGPAGGCAYLVESEEDIVRSPLFHRLVAIYNGLAPADSHVSRFESRTVGVKRLLALLATNATPSGVASSSNVETKTMSVKINAGGSRAKLINATDGIRSTSEIAAELGVEPNVVVRRLKILKSRKGIDVVIENDIPKLTFPDGKSLTDYTQSVAE